MIDLTNPDKLKFKDMPKEAQWALIGAKKCGQKIQFFSEECGGQWICKKLTGKLQQHLIYRLAPKTAPLVVHHWWALPDWVQWVARDESGYLYGYEKRPFAGNSCWCLNKYKNVCLTVSPAVIDPGTCDWREAIAQRPQEGEG